MAHAWLAALQRECSCCIAFRQRGGAADLTCLCSHDRLRESMILPDDLPLPTAMGRSSDAADRPVPRSSSYRRRAEVVSSADSRSAAREERPEAATDRRTSGEPRPSWQSSRRTAATAEQQLDLADGGSGEVRRCSGCRQSRARHCTHTAMTCWSVSLPHCLLDPSRPHDFDAPPPLLQAVSFHLCFARVQAVQRGAVPEEQRGRVRSHDREAGRERRQPASSSAGPPSFDDDPLLSSATRDDGPATPVMPRLLGRRADGPAARSSAVPATRPIAPEPGAAMPGRSQAGSAAAAARDASQQPTSQPGGGAMGDGDEGDAPYLQVP